MAIYHCSISNVSRIVGSSSTATLSYIQGQKVKDERRGKTFYGFGRTERVEAIGTILPEYAPKDFQDSSVLFNSIELFEKANNARTAKKIEVALPRENSLEQHVSIIERYIQTQLTSKGYCASYAIHADETNQNPHAHILVANRRIDQQTGIWEKTKQKMEYALDEQGERVPILDPSTGQQKTDKPNRKQWKRISVDQNPLDKREFLQELRRRERVIRIFPNQESVIRLLGALLCEQSERWQSSRKWLDMTEYLQQEASPEQLDEVRKAA